MGLKWFEKLLLGGIAAVVAFVIFLGILCGLGIIPRD